MSDSDFWRNLANEFHAIDPYGLLRADWHLRTRVGEEPPSIAEWRLPGGRLTLSIQLKFEALARRVGPKVHPFMDSLDGWLEAIRGSGLNSEDQQGIGAETNDSGEIIANLYFGTVSQICHVSANLCRHYESVALEAERIAENLRESKAKSEEARQSTDEHAEVPIQSPAPTRLSREERLKVFITENHTSIAAACSAAQVFKPQMQQWRHEQLADTSAMSQRIEDVLSGKRPIGARGKNCSLTPRRPR
jgi:hypothetical protein